MLGRSRVALWCLLAGCAGGPISDFPAGALGSDSESGGKAPPRGEDEEAPSNDNAAGDGDSDNGNEFGEPVLPPPNSAGPLDGGVGPERPCVGEAVEGDAGVSDSGVCTGDECPLTRGELDELVVAGGACTSPAELDLVCDGEIHSAIGECNESSLIESAGFGLVENCTLTAPALSSASEACIDCYLAANRCTLVNCLAECLAPATADACDACRATNCAAALSTCTGLPAL